MPRRLLKKFMPDHKKIREHKHLQCFGKLLHNPALWHLNRHSVARAFAVGLFFAWVPFPFQMVMATAGAIYFHANLPISAALVWITNPFTIPPFYYGAYLLGAMFVGESEEGFEVEFSIESLLQGMSTAWEPFLLGCFIIASSSALLGYFGIGCAWRLMVLRRWRNRHALPKQP
jgi:uncharacterized protein (DUF2062 family)